MRRLTVSDKAYIAKFYEIDGLESIACAVDRHRTTVRGIYLEMQQEGTLRDFKLIWDKQFLEINPSRWF